MVNQSRLKLVGQPEFPQNSIDGDYPSRRGKTFLRSRVTVEKKDRILKWCEDHHVTIQDVTEMLWDGLLSREIVKPMPPPSPAFVVTLALDYFKQWVKPIVSPNDEAAARSVMHLDLAVIKIGLLMATIRNYEAPGANPINSFKYCLPVIQEYGAELDVDFLNNFLVPHYERKIENFKRGIFPAWYQGAMRDKFKPSPDGGS